jgi:hypothetical protein
LSVGLSICTLYAAVMACRKQPPKDLTGIHQRDDAYQVRVSAGYDPLTGRQLTLSRLADTEGAVVLVRDRLRAQVRDNTAARTNVTLGYLLDEWLSWNRQRGSQRGAHPRPPDHSLRYCSKAARARAETVLPALSGVHGSSLARS